MSDAVNHPAHYTDGKIEVIDFIEDKKLPYHLGNAIKYICRAGKKDPDKTIEDLQKADWYINRYIKYISEPAFEPADGFAKDCAPVCGNCLHWVKDMRILSEAGCCTISDEITEAGDLCSI